MKQFFIKDAAAHENQVITSYFLVSTKQIKPKKSGDIYLALTLCDRTGQLDAKMWDNVADAVDAFEQDDFIKVKGLINKYSNRFQLTIHKLRRMDDGEIEYCDYLPKTTKDVDELWRTIGSYVASFENGYLKSLLEAFMGDPQIAEAYRQAPAAKSLHHAFIGGLIEHVVSLMRLCDSVARLYPQINRDLLLTGAFLHDIGKIYELNYQRSFSYTTKGQLLGHMIIELEMLHEKIGLVPDFPPELKTLVEHLIISHHGKYEFGSPKLPMFPEALMLHYLDDLDSKMESMRAHFERDSEAEWTGFNGSLGRTLLNSHNVLAKLAGAGVAPASSSEAEPEPAVMKAVVGELD
jgi:3'-5' exoribonuclease